MTSNHRKQERPVGQSALFLVGALSAQLQLKASADQRQIIAGNLPSPATGEEIPSGPPVL